MKKIKQNSLIVSCQAEEGEPLYGKETMLKMALAAKIGGADAIRTLYPDVVEEIKKHIDLPIIGLTKNRNFKGAFITTTKKDIEELAKAGTDFVALDCTRRERPEPLEELFIYIRTKYPEIGIVADIADISDVENIIRLKPDYIATTLSGYTDYSIGRPTPDLDLISDIVKITKIPVIAEGNYTYPYQVRKAIIKGAYAVTVGSAITRPQIITKIFKDHLRDLENKDLQAVGIDIGGTWTRGVLVDRFGQILRKEKLRTANKGETVIVNMLSLIKNLKTEDTNFIGIATGGKINFEKGIVEFSTDLIPDWQGVNIADLVEDEFNIRPKVDNDANCASYCQHFKTKENNLLMITVGTGLGGGIVMNGEVIRGVRGSGGEIGHIIFPGNNNKCSCGKTGCVETILSGKYLKENIYEKEYSREVLEKIDNYSKTMAWLIDSVKTTIGFEKCYLGGVLPNYGEIMLSNIKRSYQEINTIEDPNFINYSLLGEYAGAIGAALLSYQKGEA